MWKWLLLSLLGLALTLVLARLAGAWRWNAGTRVLRAHLDAAQQLDPSASVDFSRLDDLPAPVQRYLRLALRDGQPLIVRARIRQHGVIDMGETTAQWKPFSADQYVVAQRPGFDWNARVAMLPGLPAYVHDSYVAGVGRLTASLVGLFKVVDLHDRQQMATGEFMRFLAESAWYPTVLLPGQGVHWSAVDANNADATLADGDIKATLRFHFGPDGLIDTVEAEARGRSVGGEIVMTPWRARLSEYREQDGMQLPAYGEVAWVLPEGEKVYWRGHIDAVSFTLTTPH